MAKYNAIKAAVNAYIKENGRKEITGKILNAVLNATIDSLGRFFQFAGGALPTDDPGTPDQNVCYLAGEPGVYTHFGNITIGNEEVALLFWDGEWKKQSILIGIQEVDASVDDQVGTPSVDVSYSEGRLVLTFHNMKGEDGLSAGFGNVEARIGQGPYPGPRVFVTTSGPNTAKNIEFDFVNIQGEQGAQGEQGVPGARGIEGKSAYQIWLEQGHAGTEEDFLASLQGNSGYSGAAGELEIVNNLLDGGATKALSAEQGKVLNGLITIPLQLYGRWRQGTIGSDYDYYANNAKRIIMAIPYDGAITISAGVGYYVSVHCYSEVYSDIIDITTGDNYLGNVEGGWQEGTFNVYPINGTKTYVLVVKKGAAGTDNVAPSEGSAAVTGVVGSASIKPTITQIYEELYGGSAETEMEMEQGGINADGTLVTEAQYLPLRIRSIAYRVSGNFTINASSANPVNYNVYFYNTYSPSSFVGRASESWLNQLPYSGNFNGYIRITFRYPTDANILPGDVESTLFQEDGSQGLVSKVNGLISTLKGVVIGADMIKRPVNVEEKGTLQYLQAFCKFGGGYYSTNGTKIAEQDATFSVVRDVSINLGHGNSLQLVSGGRAWASGWDDGKMYRVDFATLSVDQTISLPFSGYTTAVVDEDNGLMYIMQRDSYPSTIAPYKFIVYDYINNLVKSTRTIESFAALQSMDYYQGKIFMLYGLGTSAAPSGMRVYNTAGDVLATFDLAIFASTEPEGIMVDRDTMELLVSDLNRKLYLISQPQ